MKISLFMRQFMKIEPQVIPALFLNLCGKPFALGSSMKAAFKGPLAVALLTGAMTCHAGWTGPMPEAPVNDNDSRVRVAKQLGTYHPTYIVPPEVCENYRKCKQCQNKINNKKSKSEMVECERKFPWANNGHWNKSVIDTCASPTPTAVTGSAIDGNYKTNAAEPSKTPPKSPAEEALKGRSDETMQKAATDAAAKAIKGLFGQ